MRQRGRTYEHSAGAADYSAFVLDAFGAADYELSLAGGVLRSSSRLNELYGYPADHPLTLDDCLARFHPGDRAADRAAVGAIMARGEPRFQHEYRLLLPDGAVRWVLARGEIQYDEAGQPAVIRGAAIDITERKRREANLAFLAEVGDSFAQLSDTDGIMRALGAKISAHLQVTSCSFIDVDDALGELKVNSAWSRLGAPPRPGKMHIEEYLSEEFGRASRAGEMVVVCDTQRDPRTDGPRCAALGAHAFVTVPFHRDGAWRHYLAVVDSRPRDWRPDELELIEELSKRIFPHLERARAEAALRESEERYRTLLDSMDQAFCIIEMLYDPHGQPVDYRFLRVNRTFERHTGLRDPVGKRVRAMLPDLEPYWVETYGRVAATGKPIRFEQGSEALGRWFELEAVRVDAPELRHVAVVFTDVTARKQAEADARFLSELGEQIRVSEEPDPLIEGVTQLLGRHMLATHCFYSEIDEQRDRWRVRHEYRRSAALPELIGDRPLSAFPPPVLEVLRAGRGVSSPDTALDERAAPFYASAYRPVGIRAFATIPLSRNGRWAATFAISSDEPRSWTSRELSLLETVAERTWNAVERLRLAAARRENAARLQQLNAASLLLNAATTRDEVLHLTAEQARAIIGAHLSIVSTVIELDWANVRSATSLSAKYARWQSYAAPIDGSGIYALVCRTNAPMRLTQGELEAHPAWRGFGAARDAHPPLRGWLAVPLVDRDGRNLGLIQLSDKVEGEFTADDEALLVQLARVAAIALENRQLYAQEQMARAQAEEASRLKDEFLATVSHELRTPLTAFLGYAQLLQRRRHDEAYVASVVEKMLQSAKAQALLIEDLLDVSRIVSGKLRIDQRPISLADVVRSAIDTVRPTVGAKRLQLQIDLDPEVSAVLGDANRLQQVVWNLLANAVKFTPPGGQIAVRLAPVAGAAELSVRDSGQGIRPDFLPYVFERFRQADSSSQRAHGGLGLGLAIVRHLVELHGGSVEATSQGLGQGATFTVRLPLLEANELACGDSAAAPAGAAAGAAPPLPLAGRRVLVVDDQPGILELLDAALSAEGAEVLTCPTAREALAQIPVWRPDLLISDIAMPDKDGYWLIRQVRRLAPERGGAVPALALTAYVRMEDRLQLLAAGFQQYVSKPVIVAELRDVILRLVAAGA